MVLLRRQNTYTWTCLQGGIYSAQQFIVKAIPENQKSEIFHKAHMTLDSILIKMAFKGHLGFGFLRLHSEWFLHNRKCSKRHNL